MLLWKWLSAVFVKVLDRSFIEVMVLYDGNPLVKSFIENKCTFDTFQTSKTLCLPVQIVSICCHDSISYRKSL